MEMPRKIKNQASDIWKALNYCMQSWSPFPYTIDLSPCILNKLKKWLIFIQLEMTVGRAVINVARGCGPTHLSCMCVGNKVLKMIFDRKIYISVCSCG